MSMSMPACGAVGLAEKTYCLEMIFNSCLQEKKTCALCPLLNSSNRHIKIEKAFVLVKDAAEKIYEAGFKKISLRLIGGDNLEDWSLFVEFCEKIWGAEKDLKCPVEITATTCGFCLDADKENYLLENSSRLQLIFRWNGEAARQIWDNFSVLKYHPMTCEVDYCLTKKNIENFFLDMKEIIEAGKRSVVEFLDLDSWKAQDVAAYIAQIKLLAKSQNRTKNLLMQDAPKSCGQKIHTLDIDGRRYPCRYFSPERMLYSALRNIGEEYDKEAACPVANRFLNTTAHKNLDKVWI